MSVKRSSHATSKRYRLPEFYITEKRPVGQARTADQSQSRFLTVNAFSADHVKLEGHNDQRHCVTCTDQRQFDRNDWVT